MNPSANDPDNAVPAFPLVPPNTSAPKVIGTLNIVFAMCLLLCGGCYGVQLVAQSAMGPMMEAQQQQLQATLLAERERRVQELKDEIKAASTDEERKKHEAELKKLEAQPPPKPPDMSKFLNDNRIRIYFGTEIATGLFLNLLLLIGGIGLVMLKEWGRVLCLWVASLKIIRLVAMYGTFILVMVPILTKLFIDFFEEVAKEAAVQGGGPAPNMGQVGSTMGTMMTASAVGMIVVGSIYPIIVLWVLSRPAVKAACTTPPTQWAE
jgi:hypothetical protein